MADVMNGEYAKGVRQKVNKVTRGVQATFTVPSAKSFYGDWDFINFYLGLGGFECGVSTKRTAPDGNWHWTMNSLHGVVKGGEWTIKDGEKVNLKLCLDDVTNEMLFFVNGVKVYPLAGDKKVYSTNGFNDGRFIVASAQQSTGIKDPLAEWKVLHNQVYCEKMIYKDNNKVWQNCSASNIVTELFHNPTNVSPYPTPVDYTITALNGSPSYFYASLKK